MASGSDAIGAARFSITIDGVEVGRFAHLVIQIRPGWATRTVESHELAHVMHQVRDAVRQSFGHLKWPPLVLKKGVVEQNALMRFKQANGASHVMLAPLDATGHRGLAIPLLRAKVARATEGAKSRGNVAIEELVVANEGIG